MTQPVRTASIPLSTLMLGLAVARAGAGSGSAQVIHLQGLRLQPRAAVSIRPRATAPASTLTTAPDPASAPALTLLRSQAPQPVLRLRDVGIGEHDLNVALYPGEIAHVAGGSPSMRLRLLTMAAGLGACGSGGCELMGQDLSELDEAARRNLRDQHVARLLACDQLASAATVQAAMAMPLVRLGVPVAEARARAALELDALGYGRLADRSPESLSPAETRLALLARTMAQRPQLLVLEDPEQGLSAMEVSSVRLALWTLSSTFGTTVLLSSSHPRLLASADRFIDLDRPSPGLARTARPPL